MKKRLALIPQKILVFENENEQAHAVTVSYCTFIALYIEKSNTIEKCYILLLYPQVTDLLPLVPGRCTAVDVGLYYSHVPPALTSIQNMHCR